ncbi:hypothetical protein MTR67_026259 [Solanum verrucosum]|uniref:Gag-pol polyprotein n=1 Tax=Solanum verrucosum TaxID=315347 RepID=A0AAF0TUM4_SOLVR|nr:hypothetical protein MTR67_026259 [Solanum verrucosum]
MKKNVHENVTQEVPQVPVDPLAEQVTNDEFQDTFHVSAQTMMAHANRVILAVNPNVGTTTTRVRDFTRMNPPKFHGTRIKEDPRKFIDEVYKVLTIMGEKPWKTQNWSLINLRVLIKYSSTNGRNRGR